MGAEATGQTRPDHDATAGTPAANEAGPAPGEQSQGSQSSRIVDQIRGKASAQLNAQKDKATAGLGSVVNAVRETSQQLRDHQQTTAANFVDNAADRLERFSNHLRERDFSQLIDEAQSLARQQPALFVGTSFAAGLLAARFIKASAPDGRRRDDRGSRESAYGAGGFEGQPGREIF